MTLKQLLDTFSWATNWNAFAYIIYKCTTTSITFFLYATLDQATFSLYCNFNSFIFLLLLWLDLGFSKSIAAFCPLYEATSLAFKAFIQRLLRYKILALCAAIPLYIIIMRTYTLSRAPEHISLFVYIGLALFITEGINNVLRLVYHAHFFQKEYNLRYAAALMVELLLSGIALATQENHLLLAGIFGAKVAANAILLIMTLYSLPTVYAPQATTIGNSDSYDYTDIHRRFIKHSAIMWFTNASKSLTERNFLVPWFTYIFGPGSANLFKIANEGALLFYRVVVKTIGTTDTALFAHIGNIESTKACLTKPCAESRSAWQIAFKKVTAKIAALCIPLLGIVWIMSRYNLLSVLKDDTYVFHIFFIICIALTTEVVCSPAERVLEVKADYKNLMIAYAPYFCMLIVLLTTPVMTSIGLLSSIFLIHVVRLVSAALMVFIARITYDLNDRLTYTVLFLCFVSLSVAYVHILCRG